MFIFIFKISEEMVLTNTVTSWNVGVSTATVTPDTVVVTDLNTTLVGYGDLYHRDGKELNYSRTNSCQLELFPTAKISR